MSTSAFIFNIIWYGHHTRRSCQHLFPHLEKVNMGTYKYPLALMAITHVGKHELRCMHRKGRFVL